MRFSGMPRNESAPEVECVSHMLGVYKMLMVRMTARSDESANVRA